jgi:hypothetical protein
VSGVTTYTWTLPSGWTGGSNTTYITATAGSTGGDVRVTASNDCGMSPAASLTVSVKAAPPTPGSISGLDTVCTGTSNMYSVSPVSGATTYAWTLPGGWTGGSNTTYISATASPAGGAVTVAATNSCGASPAASLAVTVMVCVGMEEPADGAPSLRIYPNPNQGEFTIVSLRKGTFVLYNSLGQEIRTFRFNASHTKVTVTHLENGVYFLVGADRSVAAEKIVVCR